MVKKKEEKKEISKKKQAQKDATHLKAQTIVKRIETGLSLRRALILKYVDEKPVLILSTSMFYKWLDRDGENKKQYARACAIRSDILFDEILDIADDNTQDKTTILNAKGQEVEIEDKEFTSRSKLRVEARKWVLAKMNPKKYGEKIEHDVKGDVVVSFKPKKDDK